MTKSCGECGRAYGGHTDFPEIAITGVKTFPIPSDRGYGLNAGQIEIYLAELKGYKGRTVDPKTLPTPPYGAVGGSGYGLELRDEMKSGPELRGTAKLQLVNSADLKEIPVTLAEFDYTAKAMRELARNG